MLVIFLFCAVWAAMHGILRFSSAVLLEITDLFLSRNDLLFYDGFKTATELYEVERVAAKHFRGRGGKTTFVYGLGDGFSDDYMAFLEAFCLQGSDS